MSNSVTISENQSESGSIEENLENIQNELVKKLEDLDIVASQFRKIFL